MILESSARLIMRRYHTASHPRCLGAGSSFDIGRRCYRILASAGAILAAGLVASPAVAQETATPGYPERVIQWTVQPGETCESLARALYGSAKEMALLTRYNYLTCGPGVELPVGETLVVPESVVELPAARVESLHPDVRARAAGSDWKPAASGMPLYTNHSVSTLEEARANILFTDRTRISLNEHTLVVIYGSASSSAISTQVAPAVELERGEIQAGLLALRGEKSATVAIQGGGQVRATSRDTVVSRSEASTTVSVFDGKADVRSAGRSIKVPTNFGTKFKPKKPPRPPRPLPPAPRWAEITSSGLVLSSSTGESLVAHWNAVDSATAYRLEVATDPEFRELILREEAPAETLAFRAEKLPGGSYYLRVRAIDGEGFLGIASTTREILLIAAQFDVSSGSIDTQSIEVSPYEILEFSYPHGTQIAFDDGAFQDAPSRLDLRQRAPQKLRLRHASGSNVAEFAVKYRELDTSIEWPSQSATDREIQVSIRPVASEAEANRIAPRLRLAEGGNWTDLALTQGSSPGQWQAAIPKALGRPDQFVVMDARGRVLSIGPVPGEGAPAPVLRIPPQYTRGICAPATSTFASSNVKWSAPTACESASLSVYTAHHAGANAVQGGAEVSGGWGEFGFEGRLLSDDLAASDAVDDAAWLGVRWRAWDFGGTWSFGPAVSLLAPLTRSSAPVRLQAGIALAWQNPTWAWISNLGARAPMRSDSDRLDVPESQTFVSTGGIWSVSDWLSSYAVIDAQVAYDAESASTEYPAGIGLGLETRTPWFGSVGARISPFEDATRGYVQSRFTLGFRGW